MVADKFITLQTDCGSVHGRLSTLQNGPRPTGNATSQHHFQKIIKSTIFLCETTQTKKKKALYETMLLVDENILVSSISKAAKITQHH